MDRQRHRRWWTPGGPITGGRVVPCSWRNYSSSGPMPLAGDSGRRPLRRRLGHRSPAFSASTASSTAEWSASTGPPATCSSRSLTASAPDSQSIRPRSMSGELGWRARPGERGHPHGGGRHKRRADGHPPTIVLRCRARASSRAAAERSASVETWAYSSIVSLAVAWPRRACITLGCSPASTMVRSGDVAQAVKGDEGRGRRL